MKISFPARWGPWKYPLYFNGIFFFPCICSFLSLPLKNMTFCCCCCFSTGKRPWIYCQICGEKYLFWLRDLLLGWGAALSPVGCDSGQVKLRPDVEFCCLLSVFLDFLRGHRLFLSSLFFFFFGADHAWALWLQLLAVASPRDVQCRRLIGHTEKLDLLMDPAHLCVHCTVHARSQGKRKAVSHRYYPPRSYIPPSPTSKRKHHCASIRQSPPAHARFLQTSKHERQKIGNQICIYIYIYFFFRSCNSWQIIST